MSKEKIITEFKGKTFSSNEQVVEWLEKALDQVRLETIRDVEEMLDGYFKGLIMIPTPNLTLNKIKRELNQLKK